MVSTLFALISLAIATRNDLKHRYIYDINPLVTAPLILITQILTGLEVSLAYAFLFIAIGLFFEFFEIWHSGDSKMLVVGGIAAVPNYASFDVYFGLLIFGLLFIWFIFDFYGVDITEIDLPLMPLIFATTICALMFGL